MSKALAFHLLPLPLLGEMGKVRSRDPGAAAHGFSEQKLLRSSFLFFWSWPPPGPEIQSVKKLCTCKCCNSCSWRKGGGQKPLGSCEVSVRVSCGSVFPPASVSVLPKDKLGLSRLAKEGTTWRGCPSSPGWSWHRGVYLNCLPLSPPKDVWDPAVQTHHVITEDTF